MFENYPMNHYDLSSYREETIRVAMQDMQNDPAVETEFSLQGSVDMLTVFPQPDDAFRRHMHLQTFSHMQSQAGYYTERRSFNSYLIMHTVSGSGVLVYGEREYPLHKGSLFFIDCRLPHIYRTEGLHWEHSDLHINGEGIRMYYEAFAKNGSPIVSDQQAETFPTNLTALLDHYTYLSADRNIRIVHALETMLTGLITLPVSPLNHQEGSVNSLQELVYYMHEHCSQAITMDDLAQKTGLSKFHLSREFKKLTGFAPNEYLIHLRLEKAKRLLTSTSLQVNQIAAYCGIDNEQYFSRLFKQRLKMTPLQYRRAAGVI